MILEPTLRDLRKIYAQKFPGKNLHHLIPRSRGGNSIQFNLYPYDKLAHSSYHDVFSNMRIDEIWSELPNIHFVIFQSGLKYIKTSWLRVCKIEVGGEKEKKKFEEWKVQRLEKTIEANLIQTRWIEAFGSDSISAVRKRLKEMMLYMVFGMNILDKNILYNNDNFQKFLEKSPCNDERLWAFKACFGSRGCSIRAMKSKISNILK